MTRLTSRKSTSDHLHALRCSLRRLASYHIPTMSDKPTSRRRKGKYRKARVRRFLFTTGPDRLTGGRMRKRHLAQDIVVRRVEVASPQWPAEFDGMRIGHVSDFHLGELLPIERALQVVAQLAEERPDFIACTGDVVDLHHDEAGPLFEALAQINAPMGTGLVLGNHDELHCPDTLSKMAENAGLLVLHNEAVKIAHNGGHLVVAGIDWARNLPTASRYVEQTCGDETHLLLAHNPKAFRKAVELGIPLTLAGHTHGGQIAMRNRPNANLALSHRMSAGLFGHDESRLYVTSGVGAWFPLRINCPAEIAILTVRRAQPNETDEHATPVRLRQRRAEQGNGAARNNRRPSRQRPAKTR